MVGAGVNLKTKKVVTNSLTLSDIKMQQQHCFHNSENCFGEIVKQ